MANERFIEEDFKFITWNGQKVEVFISFGLGPLRERIVYIFRIMCDNRDVSHKLAFPLEAPIWLDYKDKESRKSIRDYIKEIILKDEWQKASDIELNDREAMLSLGFLVEGRKLVFHRSENSITRERNIARREILSIIDKSEQIYVLRIQIFSEIHLPETIVNKEIEWLLMRRHLRYHEGISSNLSITPDGQDYLMELKSPSKKQVFIIMDCDSRFAEIDRIFREAVGDNYEIIVQERTETKEDTVLKDIEENIKNASFVIADITGRDPGNGNRFNPNCLFELGMAKQAKKKIIYSVQRKIVEENGAINLPFDFKNLPFTFWDDENLSDFRGEIIGRVTQVKQNIENQ